MSNLIHAFGSGRGALLATGVTALLLAAVTIVPVQPQRDQRRGTIGIGAPYPGRGGVYQWADHGPLRWKPVTWACGEWVYLVDEAGEGWSATWFDRDRIRWDLAAVQAWLAVSLCAAALAANRRGRARERRAPAGVWPGPNPAAAPEWAEPLSRRRGWAVPIVLCTLCALYASLIAAPLRVHSGSSKPPHPPLSAVTLRPVSELRVLPIWYVIGRASRPFFRDRIWVWKYTAELPCLAAIQLPILLLGGGLLALDRRRVRRLPA